MSIKRSLLFLLLLMTLIAVMMFDGCSRPPEAEKAAAQAAMAVSRSEGADRYCPKEFAEATNLWLAAEALVKKKKYGEAKQGYLDAKIAFEKATAAVAAIRAAMVSDAAAAVASVEEGWRKLEGMAKKAEPKMGDKTLLEVDLKNFLEDLQAAKGMITTDPAEAKAKAIHLARFIDTYGTYFKNLAAHRARPPVPRKKAHAGEEE